MTNKIGNGVNGKYMEYIDYTIKHIDKMEDLKGFEWEYKNNEFILDGEYKGLLFLKHKDAIFVNGFIYSTNLRSISELNLSELKFYGLKVILNEKSKITRKERDIIESILENECCILYIARDKDKSLGAFDTYPRQKRGEWCVESCNSVFHIDTNLFKFITWESQKAWSKAELMELEVMDQ